MARRIGMIIVAVALLGIAAVAILTNREARATEVRADPRELYDPIVGGEDFPGGLRWPISRDGIRPIYEPSFIPAGDVDWQGADLVIGVEIGGEARAYPIGLLGAREMVNDWVGDVPILVTWCPLCGTGIVHERSLDGEPVLFGNQGALWGNAMTWWDHITGSIWSQPIGEAIAGPFEGRSLKVLPSTLTTWDAWLAGHPHTTALDGPTYDSGTSLDLLAIVVDLEGEAAAYAIDGLRGHGVVNDVVGGLQIAVLPPNADHSWAVFSREVAGQTVTLEYSNAVLTDVETASTWDPTTGEATAGTLQGERLVPVPASTVFPKDFVTFWPAGTVWEPPRN